MRSYTNPLRKNCWNFEKTQFPTIFGLLQYLSPPPLQRYVNKHLLRKTMPCKNNLKISSNIPHAILMWKFLPSKHRPTPYLGPPNSLTQLKLALQPIVSSGATNLNTDFIPPVKSNDLPAPVYRCYLQDIVKQSTSPKTAKESPAWISKVPILA